MRNKRFNRYYLLACLGVLLASFYPLWMGVRVIADMIMDGTVLKENYPKYIIPYTPIRIAILVFVGLMPVCMGKCKKYAFWVAVVGAVALFFGIELLFEEKVVVSGMETVTKLENWQMSMCYSPPEGWGETVTTYKQKTAVEILMGEYNPAFKLHFYAISVALIAAVLNALYGFGAMVQSGDKSRRKALSLQSVCTVLFLGLCILACFTAFWRDGSIRVSPLSATLMVIFFIILGVTAGLFAGSFLLKKSRFTAVWIPGIIASAMTLLMYIGEMILLNGYLYIYGKGFLFESLPGIVLTPADLLVILASGGITLGICHMLNGKKSRKIAEN